MQNTIILIKPIFQPLNQYNYRYFPGWVCRFYVAEDVPKAVVEVLQEEGSEIIDIPKGKGYVSGMFWRFLVAVDESVDRYIIRDSDSRLNSRDAMAVQVSISLRFNGLFSVLSASCVMWSGALDSSGVLQSCSITSLT